MHSRFLVGLVGLARPASSLGRNSRNLPQTRLLQQPAAARSFHRIVSNGRLRTICTCPVISARPHLAAPPSRIQSRNLSAETKKYIVDQTWLGLKWSVIGWTFVFLGGVMWFGVNLEYAEAENPTPSEWRFFTRQALRAARADLDPKLLDTVGFLDYARAGTSYLRVLHDLEDREKEGRGLDDGGEIYIPGVGTAGVNYSAKSWPWRAGYVETIMGLAKCAEHCDGMVVDRTRGVVFPREVVIGPSNPDPRPVPTWSQAAPLEENCEAPFPEPESFYMRILTGVGFTSKQKLDAALAYANWLEFKGLHDSAGEMYKWGVDIALRGLPAEADLSAVMDGNSGVLKSANLVTNNLLTASTALAVHLARIGDLSSALPIFLSVLRARRDAPIASPDTASPPDAIMLSAPAPEKGLLSRVFRDQPFPPPPPSDDNPFVRTSIEPTCDEAELMLYIGEILFVSSAAGKARGKTSEDEGVSWTRQAVSIAEAHLLDPPSPTRNLSPAERTKCRQCLDTGVRNWEQMLERLLSQNVPDHKGWFGRSNPAVAKTQDMLLGDVERVARLRTRMKADEA